MRNIFWNIKNGEILLRHFFVGSSTVFLVYLFWLFRPELSFNLRLWRALGDVGFVLLFATSAIGPLSELWPQVLRLTSWRRETGIWFIILGLAHFIRVRAYAKTEPGLVFPITTGFIALFLAVALAATSFPRLVTFLGIFSRKWLRYSSRLIFYLVSSHIAYFLFIRYPEPDWFKYPFLIMVLIVIILQGVSFVKGKTRSNDNQ